LLALLLRAVVMVAVLGGMSCARASARRSVPFIHLRIHVLFFFEACRAISTARCVDRFMQYFTSNSQVFLLIVVLSGCGCSDTVLAARRAARRLGAVEERRDASRVM
jgi:hypothetical protein